MARSQFSVGGTIPLREVVGVEDPDLELFTRCFAVRAQVIEYLLDSKGERHAAVTKKLILPDIEPEDLNSPRQWRRGRAPLRPSEVKNETVEIS